MDKNIVLDALPQNISFITNNIHWRPPSARKYHYVQKGFTMRREASSSENPTKSKLCSVYYTVQDLNKDSTGDIVLSCMHTLQIATRSYPQDICLGLPSNDICILFSSSPCSIINSVTKHFQMGGNDYWDKKQKVYTIITGSTAALQTMYSSTSFVVLLLRNVSVWWKRRPITLPSKAESKVVHLLKRSKIPLIHLTCIL